jgi:hypothetical protein
VDEAPLGRFVAIHLDHVELEERGVHAGARPPIVDAPGRTRPAAAMVDRRRQG